jgi:hypothetical protein
MRHREGAIRESLATRHRAWVPRSLSGEEKPARPQAEKAVLDRG